ncbi:MULTISPECIES: hypothetical protein [unclassified Streptomyces]|uniref:hypothetical protein n=1 Tax=unclassified Streptomyces TaxID=2593676 RepID=UPI002966CB70|nr:hypothetical protein [Streptomyces sp. SJL17-1]
MLPVLATALLTLTVTACSSDRADTAAPPPSSSPAAREPALTKQEALAQLTRHATTRNTAMQRLDHTLLDTVEGGPQLDQSLADLKESSARPDGQGPATRRVAYDTASAQLYIPRFAPGEKRWFAATVDVGSTVVKRSRILVFARNAGGWELAASADLNTDVPPQIALDEDGYATAVTATTAADRLRSAVLDNFVTGGEKDGRKVFAPSVASRLQIRVHDEIGSRLKPKGTTVFGPAGTPHADAYGLKTADGRTLVIFSHAHTQTDSAAQPGLRIRPDEEERAWLGTTPLASITYTFTCVDVATDTGAGAPADLLTYACGRTNATGPSFGI